MKDTVYFVMPAYNEAENIEEVIQQWHPVCERINAEGHTGRWTNPIQVTARPRQGGVNSINMKRIFGIGVKAVGDFRTINKGIKSKIDN